MNITIDERTKHRLTGLVVIMAVAIIFVPAMLKKSNQRLEKNIHVSVKLPPKPTLPKVSVAEKDTVFETVKVAKMELPKPIESVEPSKIARVDTLTPKAPPKKIIQTKPEHTAPYAVQLAVFSQKENADKLVAELKEKGYQARYRMITSETGTSTYRVTVGQLEDRADARALKNKLIESTKIKGFVIKRDIG